MVVLKLGAWNELVDEINKMVAGNFIDAVVISHVSRETGATIEKWVYNPSPTELEVVSHLLPPCKGYEILGKEQITVAERTLRVARVNCITLRPS